jgi:hypothetical protein
MEKSYEEILRVLKRLNKSPEGFALNSTISIDRSRHLMRAVYFVHRDPIDRDFFSKLEERANE